MRKFPIIYKYLVLFLGVNVLVRIIGYGTNWPNSGLSNLSFIWTRFVAGITSSVGFSAGDVLYVLLGLLLFGLLVNMARLAIKKQWKSLVRNCGQLVLSMTIFYMIFIFSWGFNYYKTPINSYYDIEKIKVDELKDLAEFYLDQSIKYREVVSENDSGVFVSQLKTSDVDAEILESSIDLMKLTELNLKRVMKPNLKSSLFSETFAYFGILGYYNPFTGESTIIDVAPDSKLLFTKFHEVSHQWGFALESEANFVGFLIGTSSQNAEFQYVSNYKALRGLLSKLVWVDPVFVENMLECYSPKMKRDREYEKLVQEKYSGTADDAFSVLNEAYLQLNNQEGLESYGRFIELIVGYHRKYKSEFIR